MANSEVLGFEKSGKRITGLQIGRDKIIAEKYILATGGKAFPGTGSTGQGYAWARELGHHVADLSPALVPIRIKENYGSKLQGLSLKNVEISVYQNKKKKDSRFGECLFAHFGLSGPIILDISGKVGQLLKAGSVELSLDLKPALEFAVLDKRVAGDFVKYQKKLFKNSLDDLLPQKMIPFIIKMSGISAERKVNGITKKERENLVSLLKGIKMTVAELLGWEAAIITSGGVSLKEIDSKTMKSKLVDNLYFAGEILDVHGPTGGYNLQICWSTGFLAGSCAAGGN